MARVWIVNPFDPLPGDPEQPGRYASLARLLRDAGHTVTWWTSSFSHRFKRPVDVEPIAEACRRESIEVRFILTRPYSRNVSLGRVLNHRDFALGFERQADSAAAPDVVIASNPPPSSAAAAARVARRRGARLIVDVQDIWIENVRNNILPRAVRPLSGLLLRPWTRAHRAVYAAADAIVGVAGVYADEPRRYGRMNYRRLVVPLGIDLAAFDAAASRGRCLLGEKPPGEIWCIYSGSFSRSYDCLTVGRVAADAARRFPHVRFIFSGRGELEDELRRLVSDVPRVTMLGFAPFNEWAATVRRCDVGWNAVRPQAYIAFPNKVFYYWAAGLAVINSIPGECANWIHQTASGDNYVAGDSQSAAEVLARLVEDGNRLTSCRSASRRSAQELWDRRKLYAPYVNLVRELAGG